MSFAQIKAADAKCGNSNGGVFKDRRYLIGLVEELAEALKWYVDNDDVSLSMPGNEFWAEGYHKARAALAKLERTE